MSSEILIFCFNGRLKQSTYALVSTKGILLIPFNTYPPNICKKHSKKGKTTLIEAQVIPYFYVKVKIVI